MTEPDPVVFVIDDDASVREGVEDLLRSIGLTAHAFRSTQEFLDARRADAPGCIVLDVRLPGQSGLEFQHTLQELEVPLPVIFISAHSDIPISVRAMKSGAVEFLTKPFREQDLLDAINVGIERDRARRREASVLADVRARFESLTPRERDIMPLVVTGEQNKRIAALAGMSEVTVKVHRSQIMKKMRAKSLVHLVRMADKLGVTGKVL